MNYLKIYNSLIEKAKKENRTKLNDYYENHHIIPRCCDGTDEKFNLVLLTPKEHWLAHLLLCKIYVSGQEKYKINQALILMGRVISENKRKNSTLYSKARKNISKYLKKAKKNKLVVKDSKTGIMIGSVDKNHPKIISGEWVFFHKGLKRTEQYKKNKIEENLGLKNPNALNITNEEIINYSLEVYEKYGAVSMNLVRKYCLKYKNIKIPTSFSGEYRKPLKKNFYFLLAEKMNIKEEKIKKRTHGIKI